MKYTDKQKRMSGCENSFLEFKKKVIQKYGLQKVQFKIIGDFIVIQSKL